MPRILVVEDDPQIARIVQVKLKNQGFDVFLAADGAAGLAAAQRTHPDLILLDVMMPVMDGHQVLQSLRAEPELAGIPVIMLSARSQEREIITGFREGVADYIVKPFSPSELVDRVRRALIPPKPPG